jgi:adenosylcobinamide-phosphate synthase
MIFFYSFRELVIMTAAAIAVDWIVGDPRSIPHPVIWIGRLIKRLERLLYRAELASGSMRMRGVGLTLVTVSAAFLAMWLLVWVADRIHPWLGYAASVWFMSTTMAVKGLKDAAMDVYRPLVAGQLDEARVKVGYIVGRDTAQLDEAEVSRAAVETVAENTVDAFVSPALFAVLGGAPLAMLYRTANTLDSMVGYKNDRYRYFGWASARLDDVLNWVPARLTGLLLAVVALVLGGWRSAASAVRAMVTFAHLHPSPNSGIPESAVAGALGIQLGGRNMYGGMVSERARMGWPLRPLRADDIKQCVRYLYGVSLLAAGVLVCLAYLVS